MSTFSVSVMDLVTEYNIDPFDVADKYPIFDEAHREPLNKKIIEHYWNYEIGQETIDMFVFALNRKMREIMPYYNQLYLTELDFDPLTTVDLKSETDSTDTQTTTSESTSENTNDANSTSRVVSSETPQTRLSGDEDYATGASDSVGQSVSGGTSTSTQGDSGERSGSVISVTTGRNTSGSELIAAYRATLLNIDMDVIESLSTLFMQLWDTGDEFTQHSRENWYGWPFWWRSGI
jgi:hypothetical protein